MSQRRSKFVLVIWPVLALLCMAAPSRDAHAQATGVSNLTLSNTNTTSGGGGVITYNGTVTTVTGSSAQHIWPGYDTLNLNSATASGQDVARYMQCLRYVAGLASCWGGLLYYGDFTGQPSSASGNGLGVEIDMIGNNVDDKDLRSGATLVVGPYGAPSAAQFTGSITSGTLSASSPATGTIAAGQLVFGTGVTAGTTIVTGSGSSRTVSPTQTIGLETMATSATAAQFNGSISATTLTVSGTVVGTIAVGQVLFGSTVASGTTILSGSGTSWTVSVSQSASGQPITAS